MDPDKSLVFAYGGVPAHLDLAYAFSFIHSFIYFAINQKYNNSIQKYIKDNIPPRHRWKGFKLSESGTYGRHLECGNWKKCMYNRNEGKALAIPVAEVEHNICSAWSSA